VISESNLLSDLKNVAQNNSHNGGPVRRIRNNPTLFLSETEPATQHCFAGLEQYEIPLKVGQPIWTLDPSSEAFERRMKALEQFLAVDFARTTLAGTILQVAFMGIELFSSNSVPSPSCEGIVNPSNSTAVAFSVGRLAPGKKILESFALNEDARQLPIGLIIYAGRNQYCHWHDIERRIENKQPPGNKTVEKVFSCLLSAYYNHPYLDLAFELGHPWTPPVFAYYILRSVLNWRKYEDYLEDMKQLLNKLTR
jgi:hypothetical protein